MQHIKLLDEEAVLYSKEGVGLLISGAQVPLSGDISVPLFQSLTFVLTNRRVIVHGEVLGLLGRTISLWFKGQRPSDEDEYIINVESLHSDTFGNYLQIHTYDSRNRFLRAVPIPFEYTLHTKDTLFRIFFAEAAQVVSLFPMEE
jgi:hypothetical protein